jgi:hypothetical protein
MQLLIDPQGKVRCLYSEDIDLATLGRLTVRRASSVDVDAQGKWWADLALSGGPRLGPFEKRSMALQAEEGWLQIDMLVGASAPGASRENERCCNNL